MFNPSAYAADSLEREALAAHDGKHRLIEEIAPIAHALEGLLEIMNAGRSEAETPDAAQFGLLRDWTRDLAHILRRHRDAMAPPAAARADMGAMLDDAVALFRDRCDSRGQTVVLSNPAEPVMVRMNPQRLQSAVCQLMESLFDREPSDRRIDIVLWRSMEECRIAFVSAPLVRRGVEASEAPAPPPLRPAGLPDGRFIDALARLRELGAIVESHCVESHCVDSHCVDASGTSLHVSLPVA